MRSTERNSLFNHCPKFRLTNKRLKTGGASQNEAGNPLPMAIGPGGWVESKNTLKYGVLWMEHVFARRLMS